MKIEFLDIILSISIFQLLVFTFFLFSKKPSKISNIFLGVFLLSQAMGIFRALCGRQFKFFYTNSPDLYYAGFPFIFIWGPSFYLYIKSFTSAELKLNWRHLIHFIPFIAVLVILLIFFYFNSIETKRMIIESNSFFINDYGISISVFLILQISVYNIISLYILYTYHKSLKDNFSTISKMNYQWLIYVIIGYTISHITSVVNQLNMISSNSYNEFLSVIVFATFLVYFNIIFFKGWQQPEVFTVLTENVKYKSSKLTKEEADYWIKQINEFMQNNKPYLNPGLTITQLAESLQIPQRILSQIINEFFNQRFFDYINNLRIEESKSMLVDPSNKKTVLEILYSVGFNNKSAYNVAFKRITGLTPTGYRRKFTKELESFEQ